jgi:hypothetical protein
VKYAIWKWENEGRCYETKTLFGSSFCQLIILVRMYNAIHPHIYVQFINPSGGIFFFFRHLLKTRIVISSDIQCLLLWEYGRIRLPQRRNKRPKYYYYSFVFQNRKLKSASFMCLQRLQEGIGLPLLCIFSTMS